MKFIKYIAAALLLTMGFVSCGTFAEEEEGTPGQTTVQFAKAEITGDYGSGYVNIPLTITSDTEEGMNSCNVSVKVKPVVTGEEFEGKHNETGKKGDGEYIITTFDLNFPAYNKYYDEKDPKKYYDEETKKWTKTVNLELKIVNTDPDEIRATFEIESSTTAIGEQKQCRVVLQKSVRDRLNGLYTVEYDELYWIYGAENRMIQNENFPADEKASQYTWTQMMMMWYVEEESNVACFIIQADNIMGMNNIYYFGYFDDAADKMYLLSKDLLGGLSETQGVVSAIYDIAAADWATDKKIYLDFDIKTGVLSLPENYAFSTSAFIADLDAWVVGSFLGEITPAYKGLKFTKVQ